MQVRVLIRRCGRPAITAGRIVLRDGALWCDPPDSGLLRDLLQQPLSLPIGGRGRDLYADTNPTLFLQSLHRAYPGPFLRVTPVELLPPGGPHRLEEGGGSATGLAGSNGHDGSREGGRDRALGGQSASVSPNRTGASDHERPG